MERIGFIGLGIMGKPMARNLLKSVYRLAVYNRSPSPVKELALEGTLSIMVGGNKIDLDEAKPILEKMGKSVTFVGELGAGQTQAEF